MTTPTQDQLKKELDDTIGVLICCGGDLCPGRETHKRDLYVNLWQWITTVYDQKVREEESLKQYDLILEINDLIPELHFDHIEGFACVGDPLSNAYQHPIQYRALTNTVGGMDDPFEGVGWTPLEALQDLLKALSQLPTPDKDHE